MDNPRPDDSGSSERDINNNDRNLEVPVPPERKTNEQEAGKNMMLLDDCLTFFSSRVMESANIELHLERKDWQRLDADITCTLANDEDKSNKGPTEPKTEKGLEKPETPPSNKRENKESLNWISRKWQEYKPRRLLLRDPSPNTSQHQSTDQANPSGKQPTADDSHAAIPQPSDVMLPPGSKEERIRMLMTLFWTGAP